MLAASLALRGSDAEKTVEKLHDAIAAGDLASASALVDFRYRLHEMLGAVFDDAPAADQDMAIELAKRMFAQTTETLWKTHYADRPTTTTIVKREGPHVWVEARAEGDGRPSFTWTYRVTSLDAGSRITQREYLSGPLRSDTSAFYPMAVRHLTKELGRTPTLAELNANLPTLQGRIRARSYRVPELPKSQGKS
ncbi:MAG: hypothetical protein EP329_05070 [Deltaproteobacteria bacterium]|nr:MAG: hypothetical protein EP329_05070 [Deltaproteobacteria bacterium]